MPIATEPMRAGLTPEQHTTLEKWLASPEGQRVLSETCRDIEKTIATLRKAREIPFHLLHIPMDL